MTEQLTPNGWPVLEPGSPLLHRWVIPGANRSITMRGGSVGFILAHMALFWNEAIERLDPPGNEPVDEAGYAYRDQRGSTQWSEHAAGAAEDLNWNKHPQGVPIAQTFTPKQIKAIRTRIRWLNRLAGKTVVEWGGEWPSHPGSTAKTDGMHLQVVGGMKAAERLAKILAKTPRGRRILAANPGQRAVIYS